MVHNLFKVAQLKAWPSVLHCATSASTQSCNGHSPSHKSFSANSCGSSEIANMCTSTADQSCTAYQAGVLSSAVGR